MKNFIITTSGWESTNIIFSSSDEKEARDVFEQLKSQMTNYHPNMIKCLEDKLLKLSPEELKALKDYYLYEEEIDDSEAHEWCRLRDEYADKVAASFPDPSPLQHGPHLTWIVLDNADELDPIQKAICNSESTCTICLFTLEGFEEKFVDSFSRDELGPEARPFYADKETKKFMLSQ